LADHISCVIKIEKMRFQAMKTKDLVYIALFAGIIAVLGIFPPINVGVLGVPITLQSMGPMLAGAILGARRGGLAVLIFLALVALGMPLLSGGRGGLGVFMGPSGGFLLGFFPAAVVVGALIDCPKASKSFGSILAGCVIGGVLLVYISGIFWLVASTDMSINKATVSVTPYIFGDFLKALAAAGTTMVVRRVYPEMAKA
jgi:biotin transport system substrate-specific component